MIIEAKPRVREGTSQGYISKKRRSGDIIEDRNLDPENPPTNETTASEFPCSYSDYGASFPLCSTHKITRKTTYRIHPYERFESRKAENSLNFHIRECTSLHSTVPRNKFHCPSLSSEVLLRAKPRSYCAPIFTANANENNDNCPSKSFANSGFSLNRSQESDLPSDRDDRLCDIEIEELETDQVGFEEDQLEEKICHTNWRQRRKSLNTNPLSSTATQVSLESPPYLLHLNESIARESSYRPSGNWVCDTSGKTPDFVHNQRNIHNIPKKASNLVTEGVTERRSNLSSYTSHKDKASDLPSSIERLVEFFESSSSNHSKPRFRPPVSDRTRKFLSNPEECSFNHIHRTQSRNIKFFDQEKRAPSSLDFTNILSNSSWDSVIKSSTDFFESNSSRSAERENESHLSSRCVYNNNANAASSKTYHQRSLWSEDHFRRDHPPSYSCHDNPQKSSSAVSTSTLFLPSESGRNISSSSCVSTDVELIDLESTRLSSWSGTSSLPTAFDHKSYTAQIEGSETSVPRSSTLIDLRSTSNGVGCQKNYWIASSALNSHPSGSRRTLEKSTYCFTKARSSEKQQDNRLQNAFYQIGNQANSITSSASANNHHNSPEICDYNLYDGISEDYNRYEKLFPGKREGVSDEGKQFPFGDFALHHCLLNPLLRKRGNLFRESREMGCIQSIAKAKVSPDRCHHGIIVEDIQAAIDRIPTEIEEKSPIVLRYRTPYFRASAHVIVPPIARKETWTVGWIQACDSMKFINQYGELGNSSWEIPALKDRRITAVSDSDGVSYPWYGNTTEIATVEGPTDSPRSLTLRMNDNFYPSVTWDIPVSEGSEAHLTHIVRDQSFTTWLAAVNQTTGRLEVLRTVKWHFYLEIEVDPTKELGKRACIVSPLEQKQPIVLKNNTEPIYISSPRRNNGNIPISVGGRQKRLNRRPGAGGDNNSNNHTNFIPKSALVRPSANNAQTLIWRPTRDIPVIVVPAKEEYKENNEVVWFTRTPTMNGHDHNVRVLSMQEMTQLKKTIS